MRTVDPRLNEIDDCLYRLGVKALVVNAGKVLLVKEQDDEWWNFPGGGIDHGETIPQALARELNEELGVDPQDIKTTYKVVYAAVGLGSHGVPKANLFYKVTVPLETLRVTDHIVDMQWYDFDEIQKMVMSPSLGSIKELVAALKKQV